MYIGYGRFPVFNVMSAKGVGKMRNCGMRKVKCGIQKCGNVCGTVGKMWNALLNGLKTALRFKAK